MLSACIVPGATLARCTPALIGQDCAATGIASQPAAEAALSLSLGNPIHLATGNKHQQITDLPTDPAAPGLELQRHYNSLDPTAGPLGRGWRLSYDTRLLNPNGRWQILQANGSRHLLPPPGQASDPAIPPGQLLRTLAGHDWHWPSGRVLRFDSNGLLIAIRLESGGLVRIDRHPTGSPWPGAIRRVSSNGRQLHMHYDLLGGQPVLRRVDTPLGIFLYRHDLPGGVHSLPRLLQVQRPDGMRQHYLHEPEHQAGHPYALTGLALDDGRSGRSLRLHTWIYDAQGRAIASLPAGGLGAAGLAFGAGQAVWLDHAPANPGLPVTPHPSPPGSTGQPHAQPRVVRAITPTGRTDYLLEQAGGRHVLAGISHQACADCPSSRWQIDHDAAGRLNTLPGLHIARDTQGRLRSLSPGSAGWPGLTLHYDDHGQRRAWQSNATGQEQLQLDARHRPVLQRHADGGTRRYLYDDLGRPNRIISTRGEAQETIRLGWRGQRLLRIVHPEESETRRYDRRGRLILRERRWSRRLPGHTDLFRYDSLDRLLQHELPEGGALHYTWSDAGRLASLVWEDRSGRLHPIIHSRPGSAGYRYGNGLQLLSAITQGRTTRLALLAGAQAIWTQQLQFDGQGRVDTETDWHTGHAGMSAWHYGYDEQSRLAAAERHPSGSRPPDAAETHWYAWHADGRQAAHHRPSQPGVHELPPGLAPVSYPLFPVSSGGLPDRAGPYQLRYGAQRRLLSIHGPQGQFARYAYNAFGQRILRQTPARSARYHYLDNQLVAESLFAPGTAADGRITRRYVYAGVTPVALILYPNPDTRGPDAAPGELHFIHADLIGAPRLVTDARQRIRWRADYLPTGQARSIQGDLRLDLRLPGQVADDDTGWHDNLLRTYDPAHGHYLEPDPLGPLPDSQVYGYAAQQPRRYADPLGLMLFAFDGTRQNASTRSNLWKLSQRYQDGPVFYHAGPGSPSHLDWDAAVAWRAPQIIENQWQSLLNALSQADVRATPQAIDILGYSRGAALARHFGNRILQHVDDGRFRYQDARRGLVTACVDLRFLGLFDTVAQFGVNGTQNSRYDLGIAAAWQWVAHAVALHEHRLLFPLTVLGDGDRRLEAPFVGAHADIGGGLIIDSSREAGHDRDASVTRQGDLSNIALAWMWWQAAAAGVRLDALSPAEHLSQYPLLHDARGAVWRQLPDSDRRVDGPDGQRLYGSQDAHPALGHTIRDEAETFILRDPHWRSQDDPVAGTVDMAAYRAWLAKQPETRAQTGSATMM